MTEEHPTFPCTVYGASKLAGECYARAYHRTYGYPTVVVRPFNTYGPRSHHEGDSGEVIPKFLLRCLAGRPLVVFGDGTQTRDFTYVSDTARGILLGRRRRRRRRRDDQPRQRRARSRSTSWRGTSPPWPASRRGRSCTSAASRRRAAAVRRRRARARRSSAIEPRVVAVAEGLARLLDWYRGQRQSAEQLLEQEVVRNWEPRRTRVLRRPTRSSRSPGPGSTSAKPTPRAAPSSRAGSRRGRRSPPSSASSRTASARRTPAPSRAARPRCTWRCSPSASGPATRSITVSHSFIATANAIRYCGAIAGVRRRRARDLQHRPAQRRGGDHARARARSSCVHQLGMPCDLAAILAIAPAPRRAGGRGRRLRDRQRDSCGTGVGADRPAARRRRLLLVPSAQAADDRRRRHADDRRRRTGIAQFRLLRQHGMSVPDTVRHASPQVDRSRSIRCSATTTG